MRALFVIILLATLLLPSGHGHASPPPIDISAENLQALQTQAAQGNAEAQYNLGLLYYNGRGVPQDYAKAREWFEQAADQGFANAQYYLGSLYVNGQGVPQDYAMARERWERAAAQGDRSAHFHLGGLYAQGLGVPQDYAKARQWYEKSAALDQQNEVERIRNAAEQGDASGQDSLGEMYRIGKGVPQDNVRAYMWFNIATAHSTGYEQRLAADKRDKFAQRMTPAQVAEAQRLSQKCQAQGLKGC
jgi:uncharacterized protein